MRSNGNDSFRNVVEAYTETITMEEEESMMNMKENSISASSKNGLSIEAIKSARRQLKKTVGKSKKSNDIGYFYYVR